MYMVTVIKCTNTHLIKLCVVHPAKIRQAPLPQLLPSLPSLLNDVGEALGGRGRGGARAREELKPAVIVVSALGGGGGGRRGGGVRNKILCSGVWTQQ